MSLLTHSPIPPLFQYPLHFFTGVTSACYILSVVTGNVSQIDRVWPFLPTIYTAYFALAPVWPHEPHGFFWPYAPEHLPAHITATFSPRALMMLGLQLIWTSRLSYNAYLRGFFNFSEEDYRWPILRARMPKWQFQIMNLFFIAIIQSILLMMLAIPTAIASSQPHVPLTTSDYTLGALALLTLLVEFVADNQQQTYQTFKYQGDAAAQRVAWPGAHIAFTESDRRRGFITHGLWAWSRHPNFLCEQTFWVIQNLIPVLAPGPLSRKLELHEFTPLWALAPCLSLCALFYASANFSEEISGGKYPGYAAYRRRVARFVPILTPFYGLFLRLRGASLLAEADRAVYGEVPEKAE